MPLSLIILSFLLRSASLAVIGTLLFGILRSLILVFLFRTVPLLVFVFLILTVVSILSFVLTLLLALPVGLFLVEFVVILILPVSAVSAEIGASVLMLVTGYRLFRCFFRSAGNQEYCQNQDQKFDIFHIATIISQEIPDKFT